MRLNRSMAQAFLSILAACIAAPSPPGPVPITMRSNLQAEVIELRPLARQAIGARIFLPHEHRRHEAETVSTSPMALSIPSFPLSATPHRPFSRFDRCITIGPPRAFALALLTI